MKRTVIVAWVTCAMMQGSFAENKTEEQLAAAAQNPLASMISVPFQNNTTFGGDMDGGDYINVLNIQPVIPFTLSKDWNLITRC